MEGYQSHNNNKYDVVSYQRQPKPSNEVPANAPSTEDDDYPKLLYTPLYVWLKQVKYSDKSQKGVFSDAYQQGISSLPKIIPSTQPQYIDQVNDGAIFIRQDNSGDQDS